MAKKLNHRDLTGDNELPEWLEERYFLKTVIADAQTKTKALNDKIKRRVGEETIATLPGWELRYYTWKRKEYTVAASEIKQLNVKRLTEED